MYSNTCDVIFNRRQVAKRVFKGVHCTWKNNEVAQLNIDKINWIKENVSATEMFCAIWTSVILCIPLEGGKKPHWCGVSQLLLLLHILHEYHNSGHAGYLCTFCHLAEGHLNVLLANIRRLHRCGKLQMTISGSLSNLCSPIWKQAPDTHFISPLVFFFKILLSHILSLCTFCIASTLFFFFFFF